MKAYDLALLGFGFPFLITGSIIHLRFEYDSERFAIQDPIPGSYGAVMWGFAVGSGYSQIAGDSGNKRFYGRILNILGAGIEWAGGLLILQD